MRHVKLIAPKLCGWCREPFTPLKPEQACCNFRCSRKLHGFKRRGIRPEQAIAAVKARTQERRQTELGKRFGTMSAREQALVQFVIRRAYMDGYNAANHKALRRRTHAA